MQFFEESYWLDFPLQICAIFEETTFVELIELIPDFLSLVLSLFISFRSLYKLVLGQFLHRLFLHLLSELIEDNFLFRSAKLIQILLLNFVPTYLRVCFIIECVLLFTWLLLHL